MPILTFLVHFKSGKFQVEIDSELKVKNLYSNVQEVIKDSDLYHNEVISALVSLDGNEVMDSWLLENSRKLSVFKNKQELKCIFNISNDTTSNSDSIELHDFKFLKCIGKGGTSVVYLVRHKVTSKLFALKQVKKSMLNEKRRLDQIILEKDVMLDLKHPLIAELKATFESAHHLNFLMDFYPGGELFFHLQQRRFNEEESRYYFCEILLVLEYLHENNILYRDLKVEIF